MRPLPVYPEGTVRTLLASDEVTPTTRRVLRERLEHDAHAPRFFERAQFDTLCALCNRLVANDERPIAIDVAASIDERLAKGDGDGWRYATLPADRECYRRALASIDAMARRAHDRRFCDLGTAERDALIERIERGDVDARDWEIDSVRFFEELLAEVCEFFYSHPLAYDEIGYAGIADAHGWQHVLGLGVRAPREPVAR